MREALQSVESTAQTFQVVLYQTEGEALRDVRSGRVKAAVIIPPEFSRLVHSDNRPRLGLLLDNTDAFISSAISQSLAGLVTAFNSPSIESRLPQQISLEQVELYPYVPYLQYMLPGAITLASNYNLQITGPQGALPSKAVALWNASIFKDFLRNRSGQIRLSAFGILNTPSNYTQSVGINYVETQQSNLPGRIILLSFIYRFHSFPLEKKKQAS